MIKISLVTITFQAAGVLAPTLESVRRQDYPMVEHVIIDGASKDATVAMAEEYRRSVAEEKLGWEVTVVSEPDKGLYDAMNKGLRRVTGDYVCFLNAGDRLPDADTLLKVAETVDRGEDGIKPSVVYGDTDIIDADGHFLRHRHLSPPDLLTWRSFRQGMLVCHQAFYARTDLAKRVSYDLRYRYSADVDWCIRVMKEGEAAGAPTARAEGLLALYLSEGETTRHHKASLRERFDVMRRHYGLPATLAMHLSFVWRAVKGRWRGEKDSQQ